MYERGAVEELVAGDVFFFASAAACYCFSRAVSGVQGLGFRGVSMLTFVPHVE